LAGTSPLAQSPWPKFRATPANDASKEVAAGAPVIVSQSASNLAVEGEYVTLSVLAGGARPLNYQWSFNGQALAGATGSVLEQASLLRPMPGYAFASATLWAP
jgi:hypothetical protein